MCWSAFVFVCVHRNKVVTHRHTHSQDIHTTTTTKIIDTPLLSAAELIDANKKQGVFWYQDDDNNATWGVWVE